VDESRSTRRIQKDPEGFIGVFVANVLDPGRVFQHRSSNIGLLYGQVMGELNGGSLGFAENSSRRESTNAEDKGQNMPGLCQ